MLSSFVRLKNLYVPCRLPVGPRTVVGVDRVPTVLVGTDLLWALQYATNRALQCLAKSSLCLCTILHGKSIADTRVFVRKVFSHSTMW